MVYYFDTIALLKGGKKIEVRGHCNIAAGLTKDQIRHFTEQHVIGILGHDGIEPIIVIVNTVRESI